jgi:hypothetical protein
VNSVNVTDFQRHAEHLEILGLVLKSIPRPPIKPSRFKLRTYFFFTYGILMVRIRRHMSQMESSLVLVVIKFWLW